MSNILAIAPHPDDEIIGCGGCIIKHLQAKDDVFVVYCTDTTDIDCVHLARKEYARKRKREIIAAATALGLDWANVFILDQSPWKFNEESLRLQLLDLIRTICPQVCYLPHENDNHVDHKIVNRAALAAIGMAPSPWFAKFGKHRKKTPDICIRLAFGYEVWTPLQNPTHFVGFSSAVMERKIRALNEHKTQACSSYARATRGLGAYRGVMHEGGQKEQFAEAFQILKMQ